ncbi:hypothetical protein WIS52_20585 [Pseudonocardia nematodicida]|uniref:TrbL/VirB6 plasmid conjugal transfer protein n=1 Tax=Pseudonocardia nematodicida TaxID=1206997 RepID=A0ABV1KEJ7_9PSEU
MIPTAAPAPAQPPPDDGGGGGGPGIGDYLSDPIGAAAESAFGSAMQAVWDSAIWLLKGGFELADQVSQVQPSTITGNDANDPDSIGGAAPDGAEAALDLSSLWSTMIWLAALIALGLFFYQLSSVALRGGRGMLRAVTGPVQFGIALAVTTGAVAALLTGADGLTTLFLGNLGEQGNFTAVLDNPAVADRFGENPNLGDDIADGVRSMILGIAALFGVIPAALGFALAMIFRAAAIMVLIATIPIAAACLVADSTASMFWRVVRWLLAAVLLKPALALVLVIGVNIISNVEGPAGVLAGTAVLLISLFCPMVLYRLLAFVDPGTHAGMAMRAGAGSRRSGEPGADNGTSEMINTARATQKAYQMGSGSGGGSGGAGGGELGGSTAAPSGGSSGVAAAARGGSGTGGTATGGGAAAGGGAAPGGVAAGIGAAGGVAAAAVVGGYLATKGAAQAAGGIASSQMAQTGIGHPGPAPAGGTSAGQISSAAGGAYASTTATSDWSGKPPSSDSGRVESGNDAAGAGAGGGAGPPPGDSGPPEAGRPNGGAPADAGPPSPAEPAPVTPASSTDSPPPAQPADPGTAPRPDTGEDTTR